MYWGLKIDRELSAESKRLEKEAVKMGVLRQKAETASDINKIYYVETDWSLIYRMYCRWAKADTSYIVFWNMNDPYGKAQVMARMKVEEGVIW